MTRHFEIVILNPVGGYDCGLFALALACAICNGQDPSTIRFDQAMMRQHLIDGLSNKLLTPFPGKIKRHVKKLVPARQRWSRCTAHADCRMMDTRWLSVTNVKNGTIQVCQDSQNLYRQSKEVELW